MTSKPPEVSSTEIRLGCTPATRPTSVLMPRALLEQATRPACSTRARKDDHVSVCPAGVPATGLLTVRPEGTDVWICVTVLAGTPKEPDCTAIALMGEEVPPLPMTPPPCT